MAKAPNTKKGQEKIKAKNWYVDRYEFVTVQRNLLALVTLLSLVATSAAVFAVARLTGSQTIEPYVIEVEKKTGIVTAVNQNSVQEYQANEVVKRYFLVSYIKAREGYDPTDFQYNYSKVIRLMSNRLVFDQFRYQVLPENPESPLNLPRGFKKVVKIKSISFLDQEKKKAQVRIEIDELNESGLSIANHRQDKIATVDINFVDLKLSEDERMVNPLGFQVQGYRLDNDVSG